MSVTEQRPEPCGWCGQLVRWGVPEDNQAHSCGRCVGKSPPGKERWQNAGRCAVLTISFEDRVPGESIRDFARRAAEKISEKRGIVCVHANTYGTVR